ncbi:MAG TPA: GTPase [bacterium]|nr:GTPase [bacterium]
MAKTRILIMGAAGRDFHNFNVFFRNNPGYEVVAFTATQIPNIEGRLYPPELAGPAYPEGIPIHPEEELPELIRLRRIDQVVFAYSDVSHETVMHKASIVNGAGADFVLMGSDRTTLKSAKPVIAVCAVRTGAGKSQTTRRVSEILKKKGRRIVAVRHPMPYGDLVRQRVQRFADSGDLDRHDCTIEEREEYEPHLDMGNIVYAGVDYGAILEAAEKEADVILWDGGNNDTSFYRPDLWITVADPHRPGHELSYYPGETNFRKADVLIINKVDTAEKEHIEAIRRNARALNPEAVVIEANSPIETDHPEFIRGRRVLVVEDGPTLTHGDMRYGAGIVAARKFGASEIVDPRPWVAGTIADTFRKYPGIGPLLPAMGYGEGQMKDLEETIRRVDCDAVVIGTPIDLSRLIRIDRPAARVSYRLEETGKPTLEEVLKKF